MGVNLLQSNTKISFYADDSEAVVLLTVNDVELPDILSKEQIVASVQVNRDVLILVDEIVHTAARLMQSKVTFCINLEYFLNN